MSDATTLTVPALGPILNDLVTAGWVSEATPGERPPGPGRPALLYEYDSTRCHVTAIYVGLRYCKIEVCDGLGRALTESIEYHPGWDPELIVHESVEHVTRLWSDMRLQPAAAIVSVVAHGAVHPDGHGIHVPTMGWSDIDLATPLEQRLGCKVIVTDAAEASAVAEYVEGGARSADLALVLNLGPEIAASVVRNGTLDRGSSGLAGRLGRCPVPVGNRIVPMAELTGTRPMIERYTRMTGNELRWISQLHEAANSGDSVALEIRGELTQQIAFASAWLLAIVNPDRFVVTGDTSEWDSPARDLLRQAILKLSDSSIVDTAAIEISTLGKNAWVRGGVHVALSRDELTLQAMFEEAR